MCPDSETTGDRGSLSIYESYFKEEKLNGCV